MQLGWKEVVMHCYENPIYLFPEMKLSGQFLHSCIFELFIHSHEWSAYFAVLGLRTVGGNI
jgi:hypothetical protein